MRILVGLLLLATLAGCVEGEPDGFEPSQENFDDGRGDVTVVAILDGGFNPYHWDFSAKHMPQHLDDDPSNDLPLDQDPATWIPGHPGAEAFASYERMDLTLQPTNPDAVPAQLHDADGDAWAGVRQSDATGDIHMNWIPGTKAIGFIDFTGNGGFATGSHGVGTTGVSVGNLHGTCPSCVFVFVNGYSDEAVSWVAQQDWIDVQTNSWGYSTILLEKVYADCDLDTQRAGVERGQQIFFSGGNGMVNAFDAPVPTLYSCQKASDWIVTVGANTPAGNTYTGSGKPVDVANVGSSYPSQGGDTVTGDDTFGGTSNAAPTTAGLFAQALYDIRNAMPGNNRMQQDGVIARGPAGCGTANPDCFLADGNLTVHELRESLFEAAQLQAQGVATASETASVPVTSEEWARMGEGAGSFYGHIGDPKAEVQRIVDIAAGNAPYDPDPDRIAFAKAVSYCTQMVWGTWDHGAWQGETLEADPQWPMRTWLQTLCPETINAVVTAVTTVG
ncbi:MAG: S8/S53 family peptidase [Thermoplasmatota archaeon]